jgi:hypothetical protein
VHEQIMRARVLVRQWPAAERGRLGDRDVTYMPDKITGLDAVRAIALSLPDVEECTTARGISFRVGGRIMACEAVHKSADPNSLMVRIGSEHRTALIGADPKIYYVTSHYAKYPACLVRLSIIRMVSLREVLGAAREFAREKAR